MTLRGETLNFLNELEWIDGKIWANVYTTDQIVIIDPATGAVEGLNGIAYDAAGERIFVTGKNWNKLFEIEIREK